MNELHLRYALEIEKVGSTAKAAENLNMSQPNISRAIKMLEETVGVPIFERTSKGMVPTIEGSVFLQYAKKILDQIDEVENMFKGDFKQKQQFSISVPRASYVSYAFSKFSKHFSMKEKAEIFYNETNPFRVINNILISDYKLGILRYAVNYEHYFLRLLEEKGLRHEPVATFKYVLLMSKNHPLANKKSIKLADLTPYMEIAHADPFVPSMPLSVVKKEEPPVEIERKLYVFERASQYSILSTNTNTFIWVSPIPDQDLRMYGLVQRDCDDNERMYKDVLICRKNYQLTTLDKAFMNLVMDAKKSFDLEV